MTWSRRITPQRLAVALLGLMLGVHLLVGLRQTPRALHVDEAQYLHVAWLQSQGKRLYRDFWEDHSPFLYPALRALSPGAAAPEFPRLDVPTFAARARALMLVLGVGALACLSLLARRASGTWLAALITFAALAGQQRSLFRGFLDLRNDPPTILTFWLGALLLLTFDRERSQRAAVLSGLGLGALAVTALWNPKWPLSTLLLGILYLVALRRLWQDSPSLALRSLAPALLLSLAGAGFVLLQTSPADYLFFVHSFNAGLMRWFESSPLTGAWFQGVDAFAHCAPLFRPPWALLAVAVVALALVVPRAQRAWSGADPRVVGAILALCLASLLEVRFVYPYPRLWAQHYLGWSCAVALIYGCVPGALLALYRAFAPQREPALRAVPIACGLVSVGCFSAYLLASAPRLSAPKAGAYWAGISRLQRDIRDGDTVWLPLRDHPIAAHDASYYWFSFDDVVPYSLWYVAQHPRQRQMPGLTEEDLPLCRLLAGHEPALRFVAGKGSYKGLPRSEACLRELVEKGQLRPAGVRGLLRVERR